MTPSIFSRAQKPADSTESATPDQRRQALFEKQVRTWHGQLGGNTEQHRAPILDLTAAHPTGLAQLYADRPTKLSSLVREPVAFRAALDRAYDVIASHERLSTTHGIATTYLAIGAARWHDSEILDTQTEEDETTDKENETDLPYDFDQAEARALRAVEDRPILRPVKLVGDGDEVILTLEPVVEISPNLIYALQRRGCPVDAAALAQASITEHGFSPVMPLARLAAFGRDKLPHFELRKELQIGQFIHPTQVLMDDVEALEPYLKHNHLVRAFAGDDKSRAKVTKELPAPNFADRDPDAERGAGDLDPAQQDILEAASAGASFVIDTAPGSEREKTVAALLAEAAASGREVVYVPGDRQSGKNIAATLDRLGLSELVLDLSVGADWRSQAAAQLRASLSPKGPKIDHRQVARMRDELRGSRLNLAGYTEHLHQEQPQWGISAYDALQMLTDLTSLRPGPRTRVRLNAKVLDEIAKDGGEYARSLLARAFTLGLLDARGREDAWNGAVVTDSDHVRDTIERVRRISATSLPEVAGHMEAVHLQTGLNPAHTLEQWEEQLRMLEGVRTALDVFRPVVFERSAADMVIATASGAWRRSHNRPMKWRTRRRLVKQARDLVRPGTHINDLHGALIHVQAQREIWRRHCEAGGWPRLPQGLEQLREAAKGLASDLNELEPVLGTARRSLRNVPVDELRTLFARMVADEEGARLLPERVELRRELHQAGLDELIDDLARRRVPEELLPAELDLTWWASALGVMLQSDPYLGRFDREGLKQLSRDLVRLDMEQVASLGPQILDRCSQAVNQAVNNDGDQAGRLFDALAPERGTQLRDINAHYPMSSLVCPIRIVPPALLPLAYAPAAKIDLVVIDGAEKTPVAELIPAIARARQLVVAGYTKRDRTGMVAEAGRILPTMIAPPSRDRVNEFVATFLAGHDQENRGGLVPVPKAHSAIRLEIVDGRGMPSPGATAVESTQLEVDKVIDLVIEHALTRSDLSLGVIALNPLHARRIRESVIATLAGSPAVDEFFTRHETEPFVVIDATAPDANVQRDCMILTVGYGKTPHGRVLHDFGEIGGPKGGGYLSEVLSRVRDDLIVVSSVQPEEFDVSRFRNAGAQILLDLLRVARTGELPNAASAQTEGSAPDRLLVDLAERLFRLGLTVVPNVGADSGVRIPLAIGHPDLPGELLVAVLTDDDDFVAQPSLRTRERHTVERLEDYGWIVYTVISTAVFMDPQSEAESICALVVAALDERRRQVGLPTSTQSEVEVTGDSESEQGTADEGLTTITGGKIADSSVEKSDLAASTKQNKHVADTTGQRGYAGGLGADENKGGSQIESGENSPDLIAQPQPTRGPRPPIAKGLPLAAYGDDQLDDLLNWVCSDQVKRSEDALVEELRAALGLIRRGSQIDAVLRNVVRRGVRSDER